MRHQIRLSGSLNRVSGLDVKFGGRCILRFLLARYADPEIPILISPPIPDLAGKQGLGGSLNLRFMFPIRSRTGIGGLLVWRRDEPRCAKDSYEPTFRDCAQLAFNTAT
jgi:hypothetical protein